MMLRIVSAFTASIIATGIPAAEGSSGGGPRPAARAAKVEGVAIEFTARKLDPGEKTPEGELKAILSARATLKTERPIRYRSTVLPPGTYPVAIASEPAGRNMFFVIGAAAPESPPAAAQAPAGAPEEKREEAGGTKGGGDKGAAGRRGAREGGVIRALFHLKPAPKSTDGIEFALGPVARGDRFTIAVAAGSSIGRASLQLPPK